MKTAIVIGATGLTGNALLHQLLQDEYFNKIILFSRKELDIKHTKLIQHAIDFNKLEKYKDLIIGDVVFCCLGTTIKVAGSQEAFKKVDFTYPTEFAKIAKANNIPSFCLQSSLGANSSSTNFYLKVKGETENTILQLHFNSFLTLRPSMLLGNRNEFRFGEYVGKLLMSLFSFLMIGKLKRYKAIHVNQVASAMIKHVKLNTPGNIIIENEKMFD